MSYRNNSSGPLVSICIPTYNCEKYIRDTLLSIINQDYENFEILLLDNNSTDNTIKFAIGILIKNIRPYQIIRNTQNLGYANNCNKGVELSSGKYVSILHGDDIYDPSFIRKQVASLEKYPESSGCFCFPKCIDENGNDITRRKYDVESSKSEIIYVDYLNYIDTFCKTGDNILFCPSSMIRKKIYELTNGYSSSNALIEDQDMWTRILLNGNTFIIINECLVKYRIHSNQGSSNYKKLNFLRLPSFNYLEKNILKNIERHHDAEILIDSLRFNEFKITLKLLNEAIPNITYKKFRNHVNNIGLKNNFPFSISNFKYYIILNWPLVSFVLLNIVKFFKRPLAKI